MSEEHKSIPLIPNHNAHKAYTRFLEDLLEGNYPLNEVAKYANIAANVEDFLLEQPWIYKE